MKSRFCLTYFCGVLLAAVSAVSAQDVTPVPGPEVTGEVAPAAVAPQAGCGCGQSQHHHQQVGHHAEGTGGYSVEGCLGGREISQYDAEQLWNGYCEGDCRVGTAKPCNWHGLGCRCRNCCAPRGGTGFGYGDCGCANGGCGGGCGLGNGCGLGCGLHARKATADCGCGPTGGSGFQFNGCCDSGCQPGCGLLHGVGLHHQHRGGWNWGADRNRWDDMCGKDYWSGCGSPTNSCCK